MFINYVYMIEEGAAENNSSNIVSTTQKHRKK